MKILDGQLKETLYDWPSESNTEQPLKVVGMNYFNTNSVAYINGRCQYYIMAGMVKQHLSCVVLARKEYLKFPLKISYHKF